MLKFRLDLGTCPGSTVDVTLLRCAAQTTPPRACGSDKGSESCPRSAPRYFRDLGSGQQRNPTVGPEAMPEDGEPEHQVPYTPLGLEALNTHKPSNGTRSVLPGDTNDPVVSCNPQGMPREDLYELRTTPDPPDAGQRVRPLPICQGLERDLDGRAESPKDPEPRWFGYSTGKWQDDYTFVVPTSGIDERTWIDRAGRPHSADLQVEERFHRADQNTLELTVTINDPKMYTKPWVALGQAAIQARTTQFRCPGNDLFPVGIRGI